MARRTTKYMRVRDLVPALVNPKDHDQPLIGRSFARFGYIEQVTIDERTGRLVAGHGRVEQLTALEQGGADLPDGITLDKDGAWQVPVNRGWRSANDVEAAAAGIALNRTGEAGGWLPDVLRPVLDDVLASPFGLDGIGFPDSDLDALMDSLQRDAGDALDAGGGRAEAPGIEDERGELLGLADVSIGEPKHTVTHGDVWFLSRTKAVVAYLVVRDVLTEHDEWAGYLDNGDHLFLPYAGPWAVFAIKERVAVIVQPDLYVAGHVLDKWVACGGLVSK